MIVFSVNSLDFTKEPNIQASVEKQPLNRHSNRSVRTNQASIEIRRVQLAFKDQCSCRYLYLNISLYQNYFHCIFFIKFRTSVNLIFHLNIVNIQATKGCVIYQTSSQSAKCKLFVFQNHGFIPETKRFTYYSLTFGKKVQIRYVWTPFLLNTKFKYYII